MQLIDHKTKIDAILDQLKGQDDNSSLVMLDEEIKEIEVGSAPLLRQQLGLKYQNSLPFGAFLNPPLTETNTGNNRERTGSLLQSLTNAGITTNGGGGGGSGRVGLGVRMWQKEADLDFMKMVQISNNNNSNKEEEKSGINVDYSRNVRPYDIDEIDTQGRFGDYEIENDNIANFRFDLRPNQGFKNQPNKGHKTEGEPDFEESTFLSPQSKSRRGEDLAGSDHRRGSPSFREETKLGQTQTYQVPFQTIQSSNSQGSLGINQQMNRQNANLLKNNDGRDSNLYRSLEQRLARNIQTMEQLIFHTRRVKLLLVQHHSRFQDYLDHLAQSQHHHLVNEEIIETLQNAVAGIHRYINVLQQLERHLEQPTRIAVEDYIKGMRETMKGQEQNAESAWAMLDKLSEKVAKFKQIKISPNTYSTLQNNFYNNRGQLPSMGQVKNFTNTITQMHRGGLNGQNQGSLNSQRGQGSIGAQNNGRLNRRADNQTIRVNNMKSMPPSEKQTIDPLIFRVSNQIRNMDDILQESSKEDFENSQRQLIIPALSHLNTIQQQSPRLQNTLLSQR